MWLTQLLCIRGVKGQEARFSAAVPSDMLLRKAGTPCRLLTQKVKLKVMFTLEQAPMDQRYSSTLSLTSALDGGMSSTPRPGRFTPRKDPVPIVQEAELAPGPVWAGAENLAPTGIKSTDRPARSESLYRLSYPDPQASDTHFLIHSSKIILP